MKLEFLDGESSNRIVGAVVVKALPNGDVQIDLGPADGAPSARLVLPRDKAFEIGAALHDPDIERIILADD